MRRPRGIALMTTLYVVFTVLIFGLSIATMAGFQYQFANEATNRGQALEAAQAGLAEAMYDLCDDSTWGTHHESLSSSVSSNPQIGFDVTFDTSYLDDRYSPALHPPWSVNNLTGSQSVAGYDGQVVPPYSALILTQGASPNTVGGIQTRTIEAVVQYPDFPYALAGSDKVHATGAMLISGISDLTGLGLGSGSSTATGSVYSGSSDSDAVQGGRASLITGKVRTPGGIDLGTGSQVLKGTENGTSSLPNVDISSFDNSSNPNVTTLSPGGPYTLITGPTYASGSITLVGAVLANATLFVNGDLTSKLGLTGTGTIFVTGKTTLQGADLDLSSGVAIFSQKDITINGGNYFQGVVYSHGNITAKNGVNVVGSVVAQSDSGAGEIKIHSGAHITYYGAYSQYGGSWSGKAVQGSLLNGTTPELKLVFWREMP